MTVRRIALRAALLMALCGVLVPVLATGSASALTRGFSVYNLTGRTLRVDKIDVTGNTPVFEGLSLAQGDLVRRERRSTSNCSEESLGSENRTVTIKYAPIEANPVGQVLQDQAGIEQRQELLRRPELQQEHRSMRCRLGQREDAGPSGYDT